MKRKSDTALPATQTDDAGADTSAAGPLAFSRQGLSSERFAHLIKLTYRGFARALQMRLREHGVLYGHWTLLRILWQTDGITQRQLSEQAGVMEPTTFGALQAMEKLGYISRQKMGRQVRIFVTPRGAALKFAIVPAAEDVNRVALRGIATEDLAATRRVLLAMADNLAADDVAGSERGITPSTP